MTTGMINQLCLHFSICAQILTCAQVLENPIKGSKTLKQYSTTVGLSLCCGLAVASLEAVLGRAKHTTSHPTSQLADRVELCCFRAAHTRSPQLLRCGRITHPPTKLVPVRNALAKVNERLGSVTTNVVCCWGADRQPPMFGQPCNRMGGLHSPYDSMIARTFDLIMIMII